MNQIAFIIPYFGKWPEWMDLYLYSCSRQKNIDFIFYTDCGIPDKIYSNTIFHQITFDSYCHNVSVKLSIDFNPKAAYKLCDLKVFYGIIHEDELRPYKWWGFGDIDLVYGDLSLLLSKHNLKQYDLLTTHVDRIAGHFTVIRKESKYTKLCLEIPNWKQLLCDEANHGIDENAFTRKAMSLDSKLIGRLYYHVIRRITSPDCKHYWFSLLEKSLRLLPSRIFMREYFTTFKPAVGQFCTYNPKTNEMYYPDNQINKITTKGGVKYTCIF